MGGQHSIEAARLDDIPIPIETASIMDSQLLRLKKEVCATLDKAFEAEARRRAQLEDVILSLQTDLQKAKAKELSYGEKATDGDILSILKQLDYNISSLAIMLSSMQRRGYENLAQQMYPSLASPDQVSSECASDDIIVAQLQHSIWVRVYKEVFQGKGKAWKGGAAGYLFLIKKKFIGTGKIMLQQIKAQILIFEHSGRTSVKRVGRHRALASTQPQHPVAEARPRWAQTNDRGE